MVNQNYLNQEKEKQKEEQYAKDLIEIFKAFPEKGNFLDKIGFTMGLIINGVFDEESNRAHQEAESMRYIRKSMLEDL